MLRFIVDPKLLWVNIEYFELISCMNFGKGFVFPRLWIIDYYISVLSKPVNVTYYYKWNKNKIIF